MVPCYREADARQTYCPIHSNSAWRAIAGTLAEPATPWDNVRLLFGHIDSKVDGQAFLQDAWKDGADREHLDAAELIIKKHGMQLHDLHLYTHQDLNSIGKNDLKILAKAQQLLTEADLKEMYNIKDLKKLKQFYIKTQERAASSLGFVAAKAPIWLARREKHQVEHIQEDLHALHKR